MKEGDNWHAKEKWTCGEKKKKKVVNKEDRQQILTGKP